MNCNSVVHRFGKACVSLVALTMVVVIGGCAPRQGGVADVPPAGEKAGAPAAVSDDARMAWWREARFGMFIHWGLYAIPGGEWKGRQYNGAGEWLMHYAQIQAAEYEPLAARFNPTKFDARRWVEVARDAGVKYIVITSKHHDGFCLFDSPYTDYDIVDATPYGRDVLKALAEECRRQGVPLCFYHSILDWHHPDYLPRRPWDQRPAGDADFSRYVQYLKNQVAVLLTNYGPIGVLWFDGQWEDTWNDELGQRLYEHVRGLQPNIIVNNRVGKGRVGDFKTPEQQIPATGLPGVDWETCMTMNDTWGFVPRDHNWKSAEQLVRMLAETASKGGNFLLNVGPTALGEIPEPSVERLAAIGAWLRRNGESIYGTTASPFRRLTFEGRCTVKGGRLYLHVFAWPEDRTLTLNGLRNRVEFVQFLANFPLGGSTPDVKSFGFEQSDDAVTIRLPAEPIDPVDSVVVVQLDGPPQVDPAVVVPIRPPADGSLLLPARLADVHGMTARYQSVGGAESIGYWTDAADWVSWPIQVEQPGSFDVFLTQATPAGTTGSEFVVAVAGQELVGTVWETGSWTAVAVRQLGTVRLEAGTYELAVKVRNKPGYAVMNLVQIELRPAEKE